MYKSLMPQVGAAVAGSVATSLDTQTLGSGNVRHWEWVFDALGDAICLLDAGDRVVLSNKSFRALTQTPEAKTAPRDFESFFEEAGRDFKAPLTRMRASRQRESAEIPFQGRWYSCTAHPTFHEGGTLCGAVCVLQDITARRQYDEHLSRMQRLDALATLVSGVAHDFNNILMPILGLSDQLLTMPETLDQRDETLAMLGQINGAARDAREIVRRLREFYGPGDVIEMRTLNLRHIVNDAVRLTQPRWKAQAQGEGRQIRIKIARSADAHVTGNERQLREVITNLIFNSIDAMPAGGTITIRIAQCEQDAVLEVCDTGTGMTEEVRSRCIEPFFTTKGEHGTGLGLAMCHGIVQRHNGALEIASEQGMGTTVRIRLPLHEEAAARRTLRQPHACSTAARSVASGKRVLLVDDEESSLKLTALFLTRGGYEVHTARDGIDGLEKVRQHEFDVIVTDRAMPRMNGEDFAAAARRLVPGIPILMLTGFGGITITEHNKPACVNAVAGKPATGQEICGMVDKLCSKGKRR